jgi:predicted GNAT family acetyltransferase
MDDSQSLSIEQNEPAQRFECYVDGLLCSADYRRSGDVMVIHHTGVPRALEGRGIASKLVRSAFDHARANQLRVVPQCSYVQTWLRRNPDAQSLVFTPG